MDLLKIDSRTGSSGEPSQLNLGTGCTISSYLNFTSASRSLEKSYALRNIYQCTSISASLVTVSDHPSLPRNAAVACAAAIWRKGGKAVRIARGQKCPTIIFFFSL
ncbi:hypothetical protein E2C01_060783 [Portunus trituberculatus]|uniref:Uncharacterized protein n=1 Tax=Portunus trituberculatus TaxID=210409 RepID=A0A5B7H928_PORTR|nr:hypothetical protein [Portunus trituberculatus]